MIKQNHQRTLQTENGIRITNKTKTMKSRKSTPKNRYILILEISSTWCQFNWFLQWVSVCPFTRTLYSIFWMHCIFSLFVCCFFSRWCCYYSRQLGTVSLHHFLYVITLSYLDARVTEVVRINYGLTKLNALNQKMYSVSLRAPFQSFGRLCPNESVVCRCFLSSCFISAYLIRILRTLKNVKSYDDINEDEAKQRLEMLTFGKEPAEINTNKFLQWILK